MSDAEETPERGPMDRATDETPPGVVDSRHSIQQSGHQAANRSTYEPGDESRRVPRRQPGPVDEEA
jgi:hypothetical protein